MPLLESHPFLRGRRKPPADQGHVLGRRGSASFLSPCGLRVQRSSRHRPIGGAVRHRLGDAGGGGDGVGAGEVGDGAGDGLCRLAAAALLLIATAVVYAPSLHAGALSATGERAAGVEQFREAVRLDPNDRAARDNLAELMGQ